MLRYHIANLNPRLLQYQENDGVIHLKTLYKGFYEIVYKLGIKSAERMERLNLCINCNQSIPRT